MNIQIEPNELILEITNIKIDVPVIILNERAVVRVLMFDGDNQLVKTDSFELIQPDYDLWLADDDLINYVCEKYNFVRT